MDEILDRLGWTFPVYLLFTKCDLISGFTDYFSSLSPTERQQVWGALYELEPEGDQSAAKRFSGEFDLLLSNLRNSRTHRMSGISRSENWGRVFMFPEEFANLKDKMTLFIETLFEANPYRRDVPLFRGTYFSSGKQLGKPFDLVVRKIQSMLGAITDALEIGEQDEKDDAYFVRDLFAKVLKSDQHMVGLTGESHRRKKKLALYMSGGFLALSLLACTWIGVSYFKLRIKMDRTRSAAVELQSQQSAGTMVEELEQLEKLRREITGSWRAFPLTAANKVQETAQGIYLEAVTRRILGPLEHRISRELDNADALNGGEVRQALRTEMMLLFPERKDEIGWGAEELALGLSTFGMEGIGESQKARDQLDDMAREFLDLGQPIENVDRRHELRRGGRRLAQTHTPREFFRGIVFEASLTCQDLTLDLLAPDQMILQSEVSIPAAFTKAGWERSVQPQVRDVDKTVAMDNKLIVMAGAEPTEHPPARETLLEIYRDAFPEAWVDFFESVRLRSYTDCDHLQDDLRKLHRPGTSPLLRIVREAAEISNLKTQIPIGDLPGMSNVDGIYRTMQPVRFLGQPTDDAPAHLEGYADQLSQVYRQVESCANDDDFQLDESVLREANHWLDDFMDDTGGNQIASALRTLLKRPIDLAAHVMGQTSLASAEARLQNEWSDQVFDFFHDKLNDTYPFSNTNRNADPKDVAEFFGPGGAMEEFEKLVTSGAAASFPGRRCKRAIDDAKQIRRDLMMTDKSFQTQFALEVQAVRSTNSEKGINNQRRIDRVKLTINGVELIDRIGAHTRKDFTWSTDDAELNAVLILESVRTHEVVASREFDGTVWSICQLFENAKTLGSRAGGWAVTWEFPDEEVEVEFYLTTREQIDPFFIRESPFRQFALPQGVHQ